MSTDKNHDKKSYSLFELVTFYGLTREEAHEKIIQEMKKDIEATEEEIKFLKAKVKYLTKKREDLTMSKLQLPPAELMYSVLMERSKQIKEGGNKS